MIQTSTILSAGTVLNSQVTNIEGEKLGTIVSFGIDLEEGQIAYAVLSFGGLLGFGNKWFAIPWEAL
jgi:sporulation protein YlmC with PRC-barrel domain